MCLHSHICVLQCGEGQSQRHRWHPDGGRSPGRPVEHCANNTLVPLPPDSLSQLLWSPSRVRLPLSLFTLPASAAALISFNSPSLVEFASSLALALSSTEAPTLSASLSRLWLLPRFPTHSSHGPGAPVTSPPPPPPPTPLQFPASHPPHHASHGSWPIIHC